MEHDTGNPNNQSVRCCDDTLPRKHRRTIESSLEAVESEVRASRPARPSSRGRDGAFDGWDDQTSIEHSERPNWTASIEDSSTR